MLPFYLDPSSGSILLQLLIAASAGIGIAVVSSWRKIKKFFSRDKNATPDTTEDDEDDE